MLRLSSVWTTIQARAIARGISVVPEPQVRVSGWQDYRSLDCWSTVESWTTSQLARGARDFLLHFTLPDINRFDGSPIDPSWNYGREEPAIYAEFEDHQEEWYGLYGVSYGKGWSVKFSYKSEFTLSPTGIGVEESMLLLSAALDRADQLTLRNSPLGSKGPFEESRRCLESSFEPKDIREAESKLSMRAIQILEARRNMPPMSGMGGWMDEPPGDDDREFRECVLDLSVAWSRALEAVANTTFLSLRT